MLQTGVPVTLPKADAQAIPDDQGKLIITVPKEFEQGRHGLHRQDAVQVRRRLREGAQGQRQAAGRARGLRPRRPGPSLRRRGQGDGRAVAQRRREDRSGHRSVEIEHANRSSRSRTRAGDPLRAVAIALTLLLHGGCFGWHVDRARDSATDQPPLSAANFVDAQLVRFGKPRDLSFLPHKQGVVKDKPARGIKVARDDKALPRLDDKKPPDEVDPLKKTHAEAVQEPGRSKPEGVQDDQRGLAHRLARRHRHRGQGRSLHPVARRSDRLGLDRADDHQRQRAGQPVGRRLPDHRRATARSLKLRVVHPSGNSQFDSSLEATLSTIKKLPPPPERWHRRHRADASAPPSQTVDS